MQGTSSLTFEPFVGIALQCRTAMIAFAIYVNSYTNLLKPLRVGAAITNGNQQYVNPLFDRPLRDIGAV